jgi:hypothetical protein
MDKKDKGKSEKQKKGTSKLKIVAWLLVGIALYVFSTGPVAKFCTKGRSFPIVMKIYVPLGVLGHHCRPADQFFGWYVKDVWKAGRWEV